MTIEHPAKVLFTSQHPLTSEFNLEFIGWENKLLTVTVTAPQSFATTENSTEAHTGFTTIILDTVMGSCVFGEMGTIQPIATIKLTTDHIRPAIIGEAIICTARYDGEIEEIAYVSAEVRSQKDNSLIATALGTFMIGTRARPLGEVVADPAGEPV
ncbi:MAG: PaaI family thioesterase [Rhizobiaceae bacterium]|nr:PaaI family thioesterase [Rhizobiaceae bacterium]